MGLARADSDGLERSERGHEPSQQIRAADSSRNFLVVNHAHKGAPIEAFIFNADTNEKMTVTLSPQNAGQLGMILIEASLKELGHR
jgi:hypothetical protein